MCPQNRITKVLWFYFFHFSAKQNHIQMPFLGIKFVYKGICICSKETIVKVLIIAKGINMEAIRKALISVIKRFVVIVASTIGIITLFGYILDKLELLVNTKLYSIFGSGAILFTAIIGTPLHETAHWIGCKLFGFKVHEVQLLRPRAYKIDGVLGYVSYSYSQDSFWQKFGCAIVGIAPMIFGSLFILLTIFLLKPEIFYTIKDRVAKANSGSNKESHFFVSLFAAFTGFWIGLFNFKKWGWLRSLFCLYITGSIAMHMTVSSQDIKSASSGLGTVILIFLVISIISSIIGSDYIIHGAKIAALLSSFLSIGLFADAILLCATLLFGGVSNFKGLEYYSSPINLNKYVEITESGYENFGRVTVKFDSERFEKKYGEKLSRHYNNANISSIESLLGGFGFAAAATTPYFRPNPDISSNLSNGDVISITWANPESINDLGKKINIKFKFSDFEYVVKKMKTIDTFDPFENISVSFDQLSGHGTAHIDNSKYADTMPEMVFTFADSNSSLSNGDSVSVKCIIHDIDSFADKYGMLPAETEKVYEVNGLPYIVTTVNELPQALLQELIDKGIEEVNTLDGNWVDGCYIDSVDNVGSILLFDGQYAFKKYNQLALFYRVKAKGDLIPALDKDYYVIYEVNNLISDSSIISYDIESSKVSDHSFTAVEGYKSIDGHYYPSLSFKGYKSFEDALKYYTSAFTGYSKYENNIEGDY